MRTSTTAQRIRLAARLRSIAMLSRSSIFAARGDVRTL
jgi:hypothetical protein